MITSKLSDILHDTGFSESIGEGRVPNIKKAFQGGGFLPKHKAHVYPEEIGLYILGLIYLKSYKDAKQVIAEIKKDMSSHTSTLHAITSIIESRDFGMSLDEKGEFLIRSIDIRHPDLSSTIRLTNGETINFPGRKVIPWRSEVITITRVSVFFLERLAHSLMYPDGETTLVIWGGENDRTKKIKEEWREKTDSHREKFYEEIQGYDCHKRKTLKRLLPKNVLLWN